MGAAEVEAFLTHLAVEKTVAASTQNQALAALLFLYKEVLKVDLPWLDNFKTARKSDRVPVVLTKEEVKLILGELICDASFAGRLRHSDDSGTARTQRINDDDDLHARFKLTPIGREKSG